MTYFIKGKEVSCMHHWLDDNTFVFDIGDGDLTDSNGEDYFIHAEYHTDEDKFVFEIWWEDDYYLDVNDCQEELLTEHEMEVIKEVMLNLMRQ